MESDVIILCETKHSFFELTSEEVMLTISICLMPYTAIKLGAFGLSELLILVSYFSLFLKNGKRINAPNTYISRYFSYYIIIAIIGFIYNLIQSFFPSRDFSSEFSSILFDFISYLFILLSLLCFESLKSYYGDNIVFTRMLRNIVNINMVMFSILYIISRFKTDLFGYQLLYFDYFAPLAANLHHTSMYLLPISFAAIYCAKKSKKNVSKFLYYFGAIMFMYLSTQTGADKATYGIILGILIYMLYSVVNKFHNSKTRVAFLVIITVIILMVMTIKFDTLVNIALTTFEEVDINGGRQILWKEGMYKFTESPIWGFGFGSHVHLYNHFFDAHNTIITMLLQSGILGTILILKMWFKMMKDYSKNSVILGLLFSIFVYFLGGDVLRRLPCWCFYIICYYIIAYENKDNNIEG